jgi:biofilm protein TabA
MKTLRIFRATVILLALSFAGRASAQTDSLKMAHEWLKSKVWAKDLNIKVYKGINTLEFYRQYNRSKNVWDKVFAFLGDSKKLDTLKPGKYIIDGQNAYVMITDGPEKTEDMVKWESHRKYIDLHYVIRGKEKIGRADVATATITQPYSDKSDAANYTADGKYYIATPAEFYLFFPSDAHRPNLHVDGYDTVKKLVIKIKYIP